MLYRLAPGSLLAVLLITVGSSAAAAPVPRIVGGDNADNGEYPFMAALVRPLTSAGTSDSDFDTQFCGGSIVAERWILTAGHCVSNGNAVISTADIAVITGVTVLDAAGGSGTRIPVSAIVRHPGYNDNTLENDIALLYLSSPVATDPDFTLYRSDILPAPVLGSDLTAIGWGAINNVPEYLPELQEVVLDFIPFADCNDSSYYDGQLVPGMICAGFLTGPPRDTCGGDSGGPLIYNLGGTWHQLGVTSFGENLCADESKPGVYAEVSHYAGFIDGVQVAPDLRVSISTVDGSEQGRRLTARITVRNNSPVTTATGVELALTRTGSFTITNLAALPECSGDLNCTLPELAPGAALSREFELHFAGTGPYTLSAAANAGNGDYYPANNEATRGYTLEAGGGGGVAGAGLLMLLALLAGRRRSA